MEKKKRAIQAVEWLIVVALIVLISIIGLKTKDRLQEVNEMVSMEDTKLVLYEGPKSLRDATKDDLKAAKEKDREFSKGNMNK